jgi:polysaccharide pyruvyl transferase WcaK-like protein
VLQVPDRRRLTARVPTPAKAFLRRVLDFDPLTYLPERPRPAAGPPTVGLVGWYGWGNYGDELFVEVFREHLEPAVELRPVLDPGRRHQAGWLIGAAVRRSDAILIGGGDILNPAGGYDAYWHSSYLRRPVFVAGVGVPTWALPSQAAVDRLRRFLRHPSVRFLATRDDESSAWVREVIQPLVPVLTGPDLVCALGLPEVTRPSDPPILGIVVRRRQAPDDLIHVRRLGERAQALGYRVRRIVLATGRTRLRDLEATAEIGLPETELVTSDDLVVLTRAIGECSVLASMKFHGVVVATMFGIPALVLMPTAKNRNFMRRIGRSELVTAYSAPDLAERLDVKLEPISDEVIVELRDGATAILTQIRAGIGRG